MAVDDLWLSRKRDPATGERQRTQRWGRGKRWRVRWADPETGQTQTASFDRKADADRHDAAMQTDIARGLYVDPRAGRITVTEYAEQWRRSLLHRGSTADRTERAVRCHVVPVIGAMPLTSVRASHLRGWVKDRAEHLAPSTLAMIYQTIVMPMFRSAVVDKLIGSTPCVGVRLPEIPDAKYYIARPAEVHALADALPDLYRPIVYLAAGCGWRAGEIFGLERDGLDLDALEVTVAHQLAVTPGRTPFLAPPKTKTSLRTNELPPEIATVLRDHAEAFAPARIEVEDETNTRKPTTRVANLLFTRGDGRPIHRGAWTHIWRPAVKKAGLPDGYGLRDLRHYFATLLIFGGANVKTVQLAMGHSTPTITLNTYVGYWPDAVDQTRSLVGTALGTCTRVLPEATNHDHPTDQDDHA